MNWARALAAAVAVLAVSASSASAEPTTLRIGYGVAAEEPLWLLIAKPEMSKNAGKAYKIDATRFPSSDKRSQAFEAGAIDIASSSANGVIFAAAEGIDVKMIASVSRESPRGFATAYYAKAESGLGAVPDLKGKTVGVNGFSTSGDLWMRAALEKNGMRADDVTMAAVPFPAMQEALVSGKIDVGEFPQPFAALLENQVKVRKIFDSKTGLPFEEELIVITAKPDFLAKNAVAVRAFLADLRDAARFYVDHTKEARQILLDSKLVRVAPEVYLNLQDYYHEPTLRVDAEALKNMQDVQVKAGFQKNKADIGALVDLSYLPQ